MEQKEVTAQVPEKKNAAGEVVQAAIGPATIFVDYPRSYKEAANWCTEEAMLSNGWANFKVSPLQSGIRAGLKAGQTQEQIQETLGKTVMGVARTGVRVSVKAAYRAMFHTATPAEQAEMIKDLREQAQA